MTAERAVEVLQRPAKVSRFNDLSAALEPFYKSMNHEVAMSLSSFRSVYPHISVERILVTGIGADIHGFVPYLRRGIVPVWQRLHQDNDDSLF